MGAHTGRCFRALRRKRRQEQRRQLGLAKTSMLAARSNATESLWQQFVGIGSAMQVAQRMAKKAQLGNPAPLHRPQARG